MATITARINSTYNGKGFKDANQGLIGLSNSVQGFQKKVKSLGSALGITFAISKITSYAKECTSAFNSNQKALTMLSKSVSNNAKLTQQSMKNIVAYTQQIQSKSIYSGDTLQNQAAYLANLGLTEAKIKDILDASTNLASAGIGSVESNVQNLAKTLSGTSGQLGKTIPEISNLTKKELEQGKAIDLLKDKYKGFNEELADNTLEGKKQQVDNVVSDIKANVGTIFANVSYETLDKALPILQNINDWLSNNVDRITNLVTNLPEVISVIGTGVGQMFDRMLDPAVIMNNFSAVVTNLSTIVTSFVQYIGTLIDSLIQGLYTFVTDFCSYFLEKLTSLFTTAGDGFGQAMIEGLNQMVPVLTKILEFMMHPVRTALETVIESVATAQAKKVQAKANGTDAPTVTTYFKEIGKATLELGKDITDSTVEMWESIGANFTDIAEDVGDKIDEIAKRGTKLSINNTSSSSSGSSGGSGSSSSSSSSSSTSWTNILSSFGELGDAVQRLVQGDWIGAIISVISKFMEILSEKSPSVLAFMNAITNMLTYLVDLVAPILEPFFKVLLKILDPMTSLLQLVANHLIIIVNWLTPIIDLVAFLFKYIVYGISWVYNLFVDAINGIVDAINWAIGWTGFQMNHVDKVNLDSTGQFSNASSGSSTSTTSNSASYTAARDIYVTINYDHSYVNGDAEEIAIQIRDDIVRAEKLGY